MRRLLFGSSILAFALSLAACGSDSLPEFGASTSGATTSATTGEAAPL